ncbi:MAG: flagellar basal body-associated FliL family protein [Oxalobacteraceae bacterium]|nr:flagellar basal body-associated FliL family protein [Oxalobacteraceae bacterium]
MSKVKDNLTIIIVCAALSCLALGFGFAWLYQRPNDKAQVQVAYVALGPLLVNTQDYAFSASLSVQTSAKDAKWASQHKNALIAVLQQALVNTNPKSLRDPSGLQLLQQSLKKAGNASLGKNGLKEVFLTDFVFQSN